MYFELNGMEIVNKTGFPYVIPESDDGTKWPIYVGGDGVRTAADATLSNFVIYAVDTLYPLDPSPSPTALPSEASDSKEQGVYIQYL